MFFFSKILFEVEKAKLPETFFLNGIFIGLRILNDKTQMEQSRMTVVKSHDSSESSKCHPISVYRMACRIKTNTNRLFIDDGRATETSSHGTIQILEYQNSPKYCWCYKVKSEQ